MRDAKKSTASSVLMVINGMIICFFLLFGAMLIYATVSSQSDDIAGKTYVLDDGKEQTLLFLEKRANYQSGDEILIREGENYSLENVSQNLERDIVIESNNSTISKRNVMGKISFESPFFGKAVSFISAPENTVVSVIGTVIAFLVMICLVVWTAFLAMKRRRMRDVRAQNDNLLEDLFDDSTEEDFVMEVYQQEISEPTELDSVGDDKTPVSDEELERFREKVLKP
ncbi:Uncharacterised protein [uncultured Ruminococcus sp.]|uniref:Heme exporter protein CcmD n=1 Tax=Massiliimalia timonensis TaxID=1987501 RepID=A0A8J6P1B1_9FIRM|nr:heme exporter protein CcmD [Massiliimalia timonensis]MBC8610864.1 heme exporter protein CcmD [Massiliimalia timonensis]MBS7176222.1 heme exporter protein CcmD [Clostridiales bacterium]SCI01515.1 Uncharacterised protein [uncultured Clostridium sp.]SCI16810.1 Uncharacterised protein [uncultured Ruminococcus sp.]